MKNILASIILVLSACNCQTPHDSAADSFIEYARQMHINYESYQCNSWDSDHDGYVSCSYKDQETKQIVQLECTAAMVLKINDGCRVPKMNVRVTNHIHGENK